MYTFKDVHIIGVQCGRTRAKELNKKVKERKKKIMETKGEEDE